MDTSINTHIEMLESPSVEYAIISNYVKENFAGKGILNILEAGCGRAWKLDLKGIEYVLTGADIDKISLEIRRREHNDLDKVIVGDLRTIALEKDTYDIIYNSFVLEHIEDAETVLDKFLAWLKPGGILILRIPDGDCVHGFLTKYTSHKFHVFVKRYILRKPNAGKPGFGPFPTFRNPIVCRKGIRNYCLRHDLAIIAEYELDHYTSAFGSLKMFVKIFYKCIEILSFGRLRSNYIALSFIIKKPVRLS